MLMLMLMLKLMLKLMPMFMLMLKPSHRAEGMTVRSRTAEKY